MKRSTELPILDCHGCGVCCLHMGYPAYLMPDQEQPGEEHWDRLPADLKQELLEYMAAYEVPEGQLDGPCLWFDMETRRCKHHQYRPQVCRDFEIGNPRCLEWRRHYHHKIVS